MWRAVMRGVLACGLIAAPGAASAQGFVPSKGSGWAKLGYIYSAADELYTGRDERRFAPEHDFGQRVPFRGRTGQVVGGALYAHEVTLDLLYAPRERLVVGGFLPIYKNAFYSNTVNDYRTRAQGLGDLKLYAGYQLTQHERVGVTLYGTIKAPLSYQYPYTNASRLGEGQADASATLAYSFVVRSDLYLNASLELKHRFGWVKNASNTEGLYAELGDEVHGNVGLGYGLTSWLWLSAAWTGYRGAPWRVQYYGETRPIPRVQREFQAAQLGAYVSIGRWVGVEGLALDLFYKIPLTGEDHAVLRSGGAGVAKSF